MGFAGRQFRTQCSGNSQLRHAQHLEKGNHASCQRPASGRRSWLRRWQPAPFAVQKIFNRLRSGLFDRPHPGGTNPGEVTKSSVYQAQPCR